MSALSISISLSLRPLVARRRSRAGSKPRPDLFILLILLFFFVIWSTTMAANKDTNIDNGSGEAAEVPAALDDSSEHQNEAEKSVTFSTPAPHPRPTLERQARSMRHIDIATGMMTTRKQSVMQIDHTATEPRSRLEKWMFWKKPQETTTPSGRHVVQGTGVRQFRIRSHQEGETWAEHVATASLLSEYLRWTFRASFTEVMVASFCFFMMITIIFAAFVYLIGQNQPQCISAGDANFAEAGTDFSDAYHLSWTSTSKRVCSILGSIMFHILSHIYLIASFTASALDGRLWCGRTHCRRRKGPSLCWYQLSHGL